MSTDAKSLSAIVLLVAIALGIGAIPALASLEAQPPKRVTISDLIDHPDDNYDQRLVISGVLFNGYWGPKLCEFHRHRPQGDDQCIDLSGPHLPFEHNDETYTGAVIEVVGYFGDTCKLHDPPPEDNDHVVQVVCMDRGGSGWINAESAKITGADLECSSVNCGNPQTAAAREIDPSDPDGKGINEFAKRVVATIRAHDERGLLALAPPALRTSTTWYMKVQGGRSSPIFFPPEIANASDLISRPGTGFRLFDVAETQSVPAHQRLCFCPSGNCGDAWASALDERVGFKRHQFRCLYVAHAPTGWWWLY